MGSRGSLFFRFKVYNKIIDNITCLEGFRDGSQREPFLLVLVLQ